MTTPAQLLVLDDFFPNLLTGFRVAEYNALFEAWPDLVVLSANPEFALRHAEYAARYPQHATRVRQFAPEALAGCKLAYMNFLNNAAMFLPHLQERQVPFVLTLYPGGGLGLHDEQSDAKLLRVLGSPLLQAVIVTVPATRDYVLDFTRNQGLALKPVHLIRGVVVEPGYFSQGEEDSVDGSDASPLRICFVAEKYMLAGRNKGYPDFIEAARALLPLAATRGLALEFHVVGSFDGQDWEVGALAEVLHFHGRLETSELRRFLRGMDLLVSPNLPRVLHPGNFDGFPTGSAVEASLCGVALVVTDPLQQNPGYVAGRSCWLIQVPEQAGSVAGDMAHAIIEVFEDILASPQPRARVKEVGAAGRALSRRLYDPAYQIGVRREVIATSAAAG